MIAVARPRRHRLRCVLAALVVTASIGFLAFVGTFLARGGHWYIVQTPSMGTSAPVGTLLWVEPVGTDDLHVGEFITFRPPHSSTTYSHRIYQIHSDGSISTKGAITAPDPWTLHRSDIVGRVDMRWWGTGWLVRAVPILLIGGVVVWLATRMVRPARRERWRLPIAVVGAAATACVALVVLQPLTRAEQISAVADGHGGRATYVSTGLLPLRLAADHGEHVDLRSGQLGSVLSVHPDASNRYPVSLRPHIAWWMWVLLIATCFVPALWTAIFGTKRATPARHSAAA